MKKKIESLSKFFAAFLFAVAMISVSATESKAQCAATMTYTNPSSGQYQFTAYLTPNSAWMYYYWDFGDGNNAQGPNATVTHIYSFVGTYYVCVTAIDSTNGCSNMYCQYIPVSTTACNLNPQFSSMDMGGGTVMFTDNTTDNGGGTITGWNWSFGDGGTSTQQNPSHTYANNNTYGVMLTVYNSQGCTDTIYNYVNVSSASGCNVSMSANTTNSTCNLCNGTVTLTVGGGMAPYTFLWGNGATTQNLTNVCSGYYDVTVTDMMGCSTDNVFIVFNNTIAATITVDTSAMNGTVILYGGATGGTAPYTYSWYIPGGNPSYSTTAITTVIYPYPSNYITACLTVMDANGCYDSTCYYFNIGGYTNCSGFSAAVTGTNTSGNNWQFYATQTGGMAPYTYSWNMGSLTSTCGTNQSVACATPTLSGTYTVCCTVSDMMGCQSTNCFSFSSNAGSGCNANFYGYSFADSVYFYNYSTGSASAEYTWDFGDGTTSNISGLSNYFSHHYATGGNYNVCLYMTDTANNCADTMCQNIYACGLHGGFTYTISGDTIHITNTTTGNYDLVSWSQWPNTQSTISTAQNPDLVEPFGGTVTIYLNVFDTSTGCTDSISQTIVTGISAPNTISGHIFNDVNGNGIQDAGEPAMPYAYVTIAGVLMMTDANGDYSVNVADGTFDIYATPINGWIQTFPISPSTYTITVSGGTTVTGVDFGEMSTYTNICGVVFIDANQNGMQDAGETGLANQWVQVGSYWASTDANGFYTVTIAAGTYTVHLYQVPQFGTLTVPSGGTYTVNASAQGQTYCGNNFGIYFAPGVQDLAVSIMPYTTVTPGFPAWYDISYCNDGSVAVNGTVTMNYDANLVFSNASPTPTSVDGVNHILTWNLGIIYPGYCGYIWVDFDALTSTPLGVDAFTAVTIQPITGDDVPSNNIDTLHQTTNGSWDPNEKEVSPRGVGAQGLIAATQQLDYSIHFQNTGTAPAVNVEIVDTLSSNLDLTTFEVVAHSHPMVATMDEANSIVRFFFSNIMLPDSGTDMQGSMGSLKYRILPKSGLAQGTAINNFADIYFDFNPPVRTQTTLNTIDYTLSAPVVLSNTDVKIYPNPASEQLTVYSSQLTGNTITLTDLIGREMIRVNANHNSEVLNLNSLSKGIYFVKIISNGETLEVRKLTVQ